MWNHRTRSIASRNCRLQVVVGCAALFPLLLVYRFWNKAEPARFTSSNLQTQKWNSFDSMVHMRPTTELRNGTDVIWLIPNSPKAVLFLAHGCDGKAVNFWDKSPECPNCVGLPEERLIALHALARRFAVVSVSSKGRCWSFEDEVAIVKDVLNWWVEKQRLEKLPLMALGASSGGYFVSVLANEVGFSSIAIMIAEGKFDLIDVKENYPPTLFVHMPKDVARRIKIIQYMAVLRNKGVHVSELQCEEFPLSLEFFSDRIPGLDRSVSIKLFELFRRKGFVDDNGYMKNDGRRTRWREAVREDKTIILDERLEHPIQEEMNLAYALHEMTSVYTDEIFKWFESHMS